MKTITISAPGKLMLFGEHAVVYDRPCIVTAVDQRMRAAVEFTDDKIFYLDAPEVNISGYERPMNDLGQGEIPKGAKFVEIAVKNFVEKYPIASGVKVTTESDFSAQFGFGSSSASTVCVLKSLSELTGKKLDNKKLFDLAYKTVLDVQGKGSGFDVAAAIWGGTLYFVTGGKTIELLEVHDMPLVIGYTGVKADTVTLMAAVSQKMNEQPERVGRIYDAITKLTEEARKKIIEGDWERVGKLMNFNQDYLRDLGVSSEKLEALISAAKEAGAWGAKLSGAGGGDCMICFVDGSKRKAVEDALTAVGGQVIHIRPGAPGVHIETDNQEEQFIVVDRNDHIIGHKTRRECHHDPSFIHRAVELFIFDKNDKILLQKRSKTKDTQPGYWSTSVGGHVENNETYEETMRRELKEELGVDIPFVYHSKRIVQYPNETEMEALFTARFDGPFKINREEMDEVKFFDKREIQFGAATKKLQLAESAKANLNAIGVLP